MARSPTAPIIATGEHIVGHGLAEAGLNKAPAHAGWRELREQQLPSRPPSAKPSSAAPCRPGRRRRRACHASRSCSGRSSAANGVRRARRLGLRRDRHLGRQHELNADLGVAGSLALKAGVDLELPRSAAYAEPLGQAVRTGASRRDPGHLGRPRPPAIFRLGLFEDPLSSRRRAKLEDMAATERWPVATSPAARSSSSRTAAPCRWADLGGSRRSDRAPTAPGLPG